MPTSHNDVHRQFAAYFKAKEAEPYIYLLSKRMSEGHICIDLKEVNPEELQAEYTDFNPSQAQLINHPLISDGHSYTPFVLYNDKLYFQRYFVYESKIIDKIQLFIHHEQQSRPYYREQLLNQKNFIGTLFNNTASTDINWQYLAVLSAVLNQFTIITGGPGTGKTTTVAKILSLMYAVNSGLKVALAAPTGKAANRMSESLKQAHFLDISTKETVDKLEPMTIHRLLGTIRDSIYFKHNAENPIPYDLVVIDESSMIDAALFSKLLDAISPTTKIILLGDKDQLASVEAGSLFGDLCIAQEKLNTFSKPTINFFQSFFDSGADLLRHEQISHHLLFEHVIVLQHSYRFSSGDGIGKISKAIIENKIEDIQSFFDNKDDKVTLDPQYSEAIFKKFIDGYRDYIEETDIRQAFKKLNQLRVLCAIRESSEGVIHINERIEKYLHENKWIRKDTEFYEHRPVMMTKNNYNLGLFNGDIGIVRKDSEGKIKVWFENSEGNLISFLPAAIDAVETVYAMTIHKSQGSEFDQVMIILPKNDELALLTRELLYTAITRAKERVVIQWTLSEIADCATRSVQRGSGITERLRSVEVL
jgi:exodeoxyribonuclease V alpha subunit